MILELFYFCMSSQFLATASLQLTTSKPTNPSGCRMEEILSSNNRTPAKQIRCLEIDIIDQIPNVSTHSSVLTSIVIRNQPNLLKLRQSDLKQYKRLRSLILTDTGLVWIERQAFVQNQDLRSVDLRRNRLHTLDWRSVVGLAKATLDVRENPFKCACSIFWMATWNERTSKDREIASPDGPAWDLSPATLLKLPQKIMDADNLECALNGSVATAMRNWTIQNSKINKSICDVPKVRIRPKRIVAVESDSKTNETMVFACKIQSSQSLDLDFRETIQLRIVGGNETRSRLKFARHEFYDGNETMVVNISTDKITTGAMGWYICMGLSESGPEFDVASVLVESKPQIRVVHTTTLEIGQMRDNFDFSIIAYPPSTEMTWLKNDHVFDMQSEMNAPVFTLSDERGKSKRRTPFYAERLVLSILLIFTFEFYQGDYALRACNAYGCDQLSFISYRNASRFNQFDLDRISIPGPTIVEGQAPERSETVWIVAAASLALGLAVCGIGISYRSIRKKREQRRTRHDSVPLGLFRRDTNAMSSRSYKSNDIYEPLLKTGVPIVPSHSLQIEKQLGEGEFGEVHLAYCNLTKDKRNSNADDVESPPTAVAAKRMKQFCSDECNQEFVREAEFMAKLSHPNVVTFYGVCLRGKDLLLLYEYMDLGDLKRFLVEHGPNPELFNAPLDSWRLSEIQRIEIAKQIAQGLAYLHRSHFVHRDLAARNCLVKSTLSVKLSDFGMSRDIYSSDYYRLTHKAPLPVRWLPPEALCYGRFSEMSDVWSYGVVLWEIAAFGEQPWRGYTNTDVLQKVGSGALLTPPNDCPTLLREVMFECWKRVPCERMRLDEAIERFASWLGLQAHSV